MIYRNTNNQGFISLFAVLLATVILAMAVGMSSIAYKQIVIASNADDANEAFYSADGGLQCAIMHDMENSFVPGGILSLDCGTIQDIAVTDSDSGIFIFNEEQNGFEWDNGNCVRIRVDKSGVVTEIESLGYNVPCADINQSPKTVERALRVRYGGSF